MLVPGVACLNKEGKERQRQQRRRRKTGEEKQRQARLREKKITKKEKHKDKTKGREDRADPKEALYELRGSVYRQAGSGQPCVDVRFTYIKGLLLLLLLLCPVQNNKAEAPLLASCCHALGHPLRL